MTSSQQRDALHRQIWQIANDVRGSVDGWDFKQYVLGALFYRFISENFAIYMQGGDESINYAELSNSIITPEIKEDAIKTKGYFIYPSQLFANVVATASTNKSLNTDLKDIFTTIENSATGYPSEQDIKGLFADFDTTSNRLGSTVADKDTRLAETGICQRKRHRTERHSAQDEPAEPAVPQKEARGLSAHRGLCGKIQRRGRAAVAGCYRPPPSSSAINNCGRALHNIDQGVSGKT